MYHIFTCIIRRELGITGVGLGNGRIGFKSVTSAEEDGHSAQLIFVRRPYPRRDQDATFIAQLGRDSRKKEILIFALSLKKCFAHPLHVRSSIAFAAPYIHHKEM